MFGEEYNACSSALCNFLHSPVMSSFLAPNIFLSILFSKTRNLCSSLKVRDQVSQPYNTTGSIIENIVQNQNIVIENLSFEKVESSNILE